MFIINDKNSIYYPILKMFSVKNHTILKMFVIRFKLLYISSSIDCIYSNFQTIGILLRIIYQSVIPKE